VSAHEAQYDGKTLPLHETRIARNHHIIRDGIAPIERMLEISAKAGL